MDVRISSKHMDLTPAIEEYATRKLEKLTRFYDRIGQVEVIVARARNGYSLEIITNVAHHDPFIATCDHEDLYACIDLGIDRSIRQLRDYKSRIRDNKHHTSLGGRDA